MPLARQARKTATAAWAAPEFKEFLRKALFEQRTSLLLIGLIALGGMYFLGVSALRCKSARELRSRQLNPAMPAQQMELDFGNPP